MTQTGGWPDTTLEMPEGRWSNVLTGDALEGGTIRLVDLLLRFPVALLERTEAMR